ncbi:MAG: hypothetical protein HYV07_17690 [Deltaproteobacteria bacterium]|nr:hypothetical protein [Deltaproteobacteria bacterium]
MTDSAAVQRVEAAKAELLAIRDDQVRRSSISGARATELTHQLVAAFTPLLGRLSDELSPARAASVQKDFAVVPPWCEDFVATDVLSEFPWSTENRKRRQELSLALREHDRALTNWANVLLTSNEEAARAIAVIRPGSGLRDDARDVSQWVAVYQAHWSLAEGKLPYSREQLEDVGKLAMEQLGLLAATDDKRGSPGDLRNRAFTRWASAYESVARVGRFLGDSDGAPIPGIAPKVGPAREATPPSSRPLDE